MDRPKGVKILSMIGIDLTFVKEMHTGTDELNNPVFTTAEFEVEDCLVAPITEPANIREQQAMAQSRDQIRIHIPKLSNIDVSNSEVVYDGKVFRVDSDSVVLMAANTPTRWNRYFRAEYVSNYVAFPTGDFTVDSFITEESNEYFITENGNYYFAQEVV